MPDGIGSPDFLSRSMFFREAEGQPTGQELASMNAPFGGSPEQAMAFLQSPGAQQMLQHFGLGGFNPNQIRQSPFLPNSFMQHHPMLGGGLSHAMANVAATPEAPLVSGAGSGMTRAMQGMMGGPELQRQYQVKQLMAPFQAMGMQMPAMAEQRRQQLLQALEQDMQQRQQIEAQTRPDQMIARQQMAEAAEIRARAEQERAGQPQIKFGPVGTGYVTGQNVPAQPAGGPEGTNFQQQPGLGGGRPMLSMSPGAQAGQELQTPGWGLTPATQAGWNQQYTPYDQEDMRGQFGAKASGSQTPEKAGLLDSQTDLNRAKVPTEGAKQEQLRGRAERDRSEANQPGGHFGAAHNDRLAKEYNDTEKNVLAQKQAIDDRVAAKQLTPEEGARQKAEWDRHLGTAKENYDRAMNKPGQSAREAGTQDTNKGTGGKTDLPKTLSPGATGSTTGLPRGYVFNEQGIPVKAPQAPQQ